MRKPTVAIIFTGGTIASKLNEEFGGIIPSLSATQILDAVPGIKEIANIEVHEYGKYPGPHITPIHMHEISAIAQSYLNRVDVNGVVVTHGTDTLEETAFYLDCTVSSSKTIVVVGSMRNSSEPDWDGPRNLRDAITVAVSSQFKNVGTVVCLAGVINAASEVSKTDTEEVNTFRSFDFGPLARITNGEILVYRTPLHREVFNVVKVPTFVPLFKCYSGMDTNIIDFAAENGASGIVVEAMGVGNVPPNVFLSLKKIISLEIPVVLVSRCPVGRIEHIYAYDGAGKLLHKSGVIFADFLNGQKARIKLLCALGANYPTHRIKSAFEWMKQ